MAKALKSKAPAVAAPVPQSREECSRFIHEIGDHQRSRTALETEMNAEMAKLKRYYEERAKRHSDRIGLLTEGVKVWCAAHRSELTDNGKVKTATLAAGEVRWRMTPPAVGVKKLKDAIAALAAAGLDRFLRTKTEIDKEAILKEPEAVSEIPFLAISQREEFVILPFETKLEEVA